MLKVGIVKRSLMDARDHNPQVGDKFQGWAGRKVGPGGAS